MGKYYANFYANRGTCLRCPAEYTSLDNAIRDIRLMAIGKTLFDSSFSWTVVDENHKIVASGCGRKDSFGNLLFDKF